MVTKGHGWRNQLTWIIPAACVPASYLAFVVAGDLVQQAAGTRHHGWISLIAVLLFLGAAASPIVAAIITIRRGHRLFRSWRRSHGHLTRSERSAEDQHMVYAGGWEKARALRAALIRRELPPEIQVWGIVPRPGERFFLDGPLTYTRYYGNDVSYGQSSVMAFGRPAWVAGALIGNAIGNSVRRNRAQQAAAAQWRETQTLQVVVSNYRIACNVAGRGWLSFDHAAATAIYPTPEKYNIVIEYPETSPLSLIGPLAPALATITVLIAHGHDAVANHPALTPLNQ
jgi:hypothetical protein